MSKLLKKVSEEELTNVLGIETSDIDKAQNQVGYENEYQHLGWYITPSGNVFEKVSVIGSDKEAFVYIVGRRVYEASIKEIKDAESNWSKLF